MLLSESQAIEAINKGEFPLDFRMKFEYGIESGDSGASVVDGRLFSSSYCHGIVEWNKDIEQYVVRYRGSNKNLGKLVTIYINEE